MATVPRSERASARQAAYKQGLALSPPSKGAAPGFPIPDADHWDKARNAVGRVKDPARRAQLAKLLRKTAPKFGKSQALKKSWAAPGGSQHANAGLGIYLAVTAKDDQGMTLVCPECDYSGPASSFGANGASLDKQPGDLRTPAPSTAATRDGAPTAVKTGAAHALANGTRGAVELAAGTLTARRHPIKGPMDVLVARAQDGTAVLKHRNGGAEIAHLRKTDGGKWVASVNGKDGQPRDHQRTALMEAVDQWNGAIKGAVRPQPAPLQQEPQQTPLMAEYGIPAMRSAAFATPMTSASSGPRMTTAGGSGKRYDPDHDGDNDASPSGDTDKDYAGALSAKGRQIYKKLTAKGWAPAKALKFAKSAQSFGSKAA
jgi:hypothetical protein